MISSNLVLESCDKKELKSCSLGTGYSGRKYLSVVKVTLHFCAIARVLLINVSGSQSLNKLDMSCVDLKNCSGVKIFSRFESFKVLPVLIHTLVS